MASVYRPLHIVDSATHALATESIYVRQIYIAVTNAGTTWTLRVEDNGTPNIIIPSFTLTLPTDGVGKTFTWDFPIFAVGGVDVITGGTAGALTIWLAGSTSLKSGGSEISS